MMMLSNKMELFQEACRLNNAGVALIASNDGGNGVKMLKEALIVMERMSRDEASEDLFMTEASASSREPILYPFVEIPDLEDTFYVYNRALVLEPAANGVDWAFSNAAILMNLALAFHHRGKARCQESKLRRAIYFYELAARLVADVSASHGALVVAALNNQAHIHRELCEFKDACVVLEDVRALAEHVPNPPMDSSSSAFAVTTLDEIFLNVTMSSEIPSTAASA